MKEGFTFLEVLIALAVAAILVTVACTALVTALRAEQGAGHLREAGLLIGSIQAETWLGDGDDTPYPAEAFPNWEITASTEDTLTGDEQIEWEVWTLAPRDRPSLRTSFAMRAE